MAEFIETPCHKCKKSSLKSICDLEYGCDEPCERAKNWFEQFENRLQDLIQRADKLLKGE